MCVVMLFPFHQLRVSPLHERIQVGPGRGGHRDLVTIGPDLKTHQSNEGPQGLICLQAIPAGCHQKQSTRKVASTLFILYRKEDQTIWKLLGQLLKIHKKRKYMSEM